MSGPKAIKPKTADVFSVKVAENAFIFGRVLFDVTKQYMKNTSAEERHNSLDFFNKCMLVEMYKGVYQDPSEMADAEIAVPCEFIPGSFFKDYECTLTGHTPVNPELIRFPEYLTSYGRDYFFSTGELRIKIPIDTKMYEEIKVHPCFGSGYWLVMAVLDASGRLDLADEEDRIPGRNYFRASDLHASPDIRAQIYALAGEDPAQSYYELALKHGYDLKRLYTE
mgnify:CR=1 FL=1